MKKSHVDADALRKGARMEFRILGPVELWSNGRRHDLGQAKGRLVLAILLMTPGRPVTVESLIHRVWGDDPPAKAKDSLYSHIARLRGFLNDIGDAVHLRQHAGSYFLETAPENIDYHRFLRLRAQARESETAEQALRLYLEADALRRGEALTGLSGSWAAQTRDKIEGEVLDSRIERIELEIQHGQKSDNSAELIELVHRFPFREKLVELLMRKLCHDGRPTEALDAYNRARQKLVHELGTEPGPALQELHLRVLRGDSTLLPTPRPASRKNTPPNTLPRDKQTFTGRTTELELLVNAQVSRDTVTVLAIDGMAGVGKTALAVHLAHRLTSDYPDAQLYLNLHGHDARYDAMDPATALDRLLRDLGIPGKLVPNSLDGRAAMWRAELARRKALILLDNAAGHDQISDLLPGAPGSLVVITSRRRLAGLDDVHSLPLDVLPPEDGATLLRRVAGPWRAFQEEGVASVVRLCGRLPLAIQLIGSRLRHRSAWSAADIVELLNRTRRRLPAIRAGNREITTAFELSFHTLNEHLKRAFWQLGLHPGADLTPESASALLNVSRPETEEILDDFLDHHLIDEPRRGRYRFHDLIREYALLLSDQEPEASRAEVLRRAFDHYLLTADAADRLLYPYRARDPIEVPGPLPQLVEFDTPDQALSWLEAELDNLILLARHAVSHGWAKHAALLAHVLSRYMDLWGHWAEGAALHRRATTAWRELGDRPGLARALTDLSVARCQTGQYDEALRLASEALQIQRTAGDQRAVGYLLDHNGLVHWRRSELDVAFGYFEQALSLRKTIGDRHGQADTINHIAFIHGRRGEYAKATECMWQAFAMYQEDGDRRGQQVTMNNIGNVEVELGRYEDALRHYEEAASFDPHMGPQNEAIWFNNVASAYQCLGRYNDALDYYRESLDGHRKIGDRRGEMHTLNDIGSCYAHMGRDKEALIYYQKALHISVELSERHQEIVALRGIGTVHHRAHRHETALSCYEKALGLARGVGAAHEEALVLDDIGTTLAQNGERSQAEEYWRRALELYDHLGVAEAGSLRARLTSRGRAAQP
ncbi:AfsR/SARP family transcriptional regulator [Streptosporangium saharense]|uniref:AfsR/SARP family transcriptional regulator n=1 Tax=Streptosporangium saharense TaxID=1706840 RepID=UPI0033336D88